MTDKERLDWLQKKVETGACPGLINDDNGHWAVSFDGIQNVPDTDPCDIQTTFFVFARDWKDSIREAIDHAIATYEQIGDYENT